METKESMITITEYLAAKQLVHDYEEQERIVARENLGELKLNQQIRWKRAPGLDFWIQEIRDDGVLIRTTDSENDLNYNDYLVAYDQLMLI